LKKFFTLLLYLNIYTCFFVAAQAQEYTLKIKAENPQQHSSLDTLQLMRTFKDLSQLNPQTDSLQLNLQKLGYIESQLIKIQKYNDSVFTARFALGKKYESIKIYFDERFFTKKELQQAKIAPKNQHFIIPIESVTQVLLKLTTTKNRKGQAFAKLKLVNFEKDASGNLSATLKLLNNEKRYIDSIVIKGYEKFPKAFLRHYAGIKKGKTFDQKKLITQSENLNSLGFVTTTKSPEVLFRKNKTSVYFYLNKENNNLFDGVLGFSTNEETQKLKLNGYLNLQLNNNLNYGEQLLIEYKADGEEQISFKTKLALPYLFKTPFGLSGALKIFKKDSTYITTEQEIQIDYQLNPESKAYIGYRGNESNNLLDEIIAGDAIEDFTSKFLIAGGSYTKLQSNKLFREKTMISLTTGIGSRDAKNIAENQVTFSSIIANIFNLNAKNSIYIQNNTSALISESYLENELFRFGGINSIRGFNENSLEASLYSTINTEYRYQLTNNAYIHSIMDVGYFENQTLSLKERLYSFGIGLGLNTKTGLLRFNMANGNTEGSSFKFSKTKVHISISSKF
tara:strand:- start:67952 stop:69649 length:1698 start_codon:yes stop_codon:yes gene_type:complete